jgi:hypothetical protein
MFSVIFEVLPNKENWDDYLDNAKMLRPELEQVEGFIADHHGEVTALGSVFGGPVDRRKSVGSRRAAMALRSFRRCPTKTTPKSFKSSAVKVGRTVSSISFSRNAASYLSRPRPRSQLLTSILAP